MEGATLFIVSAARKLRAGAVFHCVWNQELAKTAMPKDRKEDTSCAIKTAIEALKILIAQDKG
jgi:uridine phosphorylase